MKIDSNIIISFLKEHPLISVRALEIMCKMPQSTIGQALNGSREIPSKYINPLIEILKKYGLK